MARPSFLSMGLGIPPRDWKVSTGDNHAITVVLTVVGVADQFQSMGKLEYMNWIIPNAKENRDAMQTAWYRPTQLTPKPPSRPELSEDEDEEGLLESIKYIETLVDACVKKGVPPQRIVVGGFSQGCAISLLGDLISQKYSGKLAGIVGLMGYLPLADGQRIQSLRAKADLPPVLGEVPVFLAHGKQDMLVPSRYFGQAIEKLHELGLNDGALETHEYEGLGHTLSGPVLKDLCSWLERTLPKLED